MTEKIIGCGALFYSKETNRFLLLHRTQSKQNRVWGLVGGTTTNELAWAGLKREIKEELDLKIKILERLPSNTHKYSDKKIIELIPFRCSLQTSEIHLKEHSRIEWADVSELESFDWAEADIPIVQHYIQNFK